MSLLKLFCASAAAAVLVPTVSFAAEGFASYYPDNTFVYAEASDLARFRKLGDHPLIKMLASDEIMKAVTAALEESDEGTGKAIERMERMLKEETGLTWREVLERFSGGISAGVFDVKMPVVRQSKGEASYAVVADFSGDEALVEKLIAAMERLDEEESPLEREYDVSTEDRAGMKLHLLKEKESEDESGDELSEYAWAVKEGKLFFASGAQVLRDLADRGAEGNDKSLSRNREFRRIVEETGPADILVAAPLRELMGQVIEAAGKEASASDPFNPGAVFKALELEEFRGASMRVHFGESDADVEFLMAWDSKPRMFEFYQTAGSGKMPHFIPPDATKSGYGTLVLPEIWRVAREFLKDQAPAFMPMIDAQLGQVKERSGIDVEKDILGRLGKNFCSAIIIGDELFDEDHPGAELFNKPNFPLAGPGDSLLLGLETTDAKPLDQALKTLTDSFLPGVIEDREYQGFTIHRFKKGLPGIGMAWAVADDWFLLNLGKPEVLEKALSRIAKGTGGESSDSFWSRAEVKQAIESLPSEDQVSAEFHQLGTELEFVAAALISELPGLESVTEALRNVKFPVAAVSKNYLGAKQFRSRTRFLPKTP